MSTFGTRAKAAIKTRGYLAIRNHIVQMGVNEAFNSLNRSKTKAWYLLIVSCLIASVVFWINPDPRGPDYSFSSKETDPKVASIELSKNDFSGESSRQDLAGLSDADYSEFKNSELALNAYLQAALVDEGISRSKTLRISRITETEDFAQYQVESTDGDPGIVTVSPGRVFCISADARWRL